MRKRTSFTHIVESILFQSLTGAKQIISASNSYMQKMVQDSRQSATDSATSAAASLASQNASKASADASASSASDSKTSETKVTALWLSFSRQWYGEFDKDPETDPNNGGPPLIGAQYYNTATKIIRQYTADGWQDYDLDAQHQSQNAAMSAAQSAASAAAAKNSSDNASAMAAQTTSDRTIIQTIMGPIVVPNASYALDYIRVNQAGTAYEVRTPAQVLADIGGATNTYADELNSAKLNRNGEDTKTGQLNLNGTLQLGTGQRINFAETSNQYATSEYMDANNATRVIDINKADQNTNLGWFRFPSSGRAYSNAGTFALTSENDLKYDKTGGRINPGSGYFDFLGGGYGNIYRTSSTTGDAILDFHSDVGGSNSWVASILADGTFKIIGGGMFVGTATSSEYGDLAERYVSRAVYPKGTVMAIARDDEDGEVVSGKSGDALIGVISTKPGLIINNQLSNGQLVGIIGRIPTRVIGPVTRGCVISASTVEGVAIAGTDHPIGHCLVTDNRTEERLVEVSLSLSSLGAAQ